MTKSLMLKRVFLFGFIILLSGFIGYSLPRSFSCRRYVTKDAEFILIRNSHSLIELHPRILAETFGSTWASQALFYSCNRGIVDGKEAQVSTGGLYPLAKGAPLLQVSGDRWQPLGCLVFSLDTSRQVFLEFDLTRPALMSADVSSRRPQVPEVRPDGRLLLKDLQ